jgi:hypothetical protein
MNRPHQLPKRLMFAIALTDVDPQLGIAGAKLSDAGAVEVASGRVEMAVLPVSEILPVQGVDFVGTIPADFQLDQVVAAKAQLPRSRRWGWNALD